MESLRDGVVHLVEVVTLAWKNIFVTGHSSNYWWEKETIILFLRFCKSK